MPQVVNWDALHQEARGLLDDTALPLSNRLQNLTQLLLEKCPHYNWVGFYWVDAKEGDMLVLGEFAGAPTEHVRIPFGKGICGQAAANKRAFWVDDVNEETNYLACSLETKAEVVLPLFDKMGVMRGQLDIDSHTLRPFSEQDRELLGQLCERIGQELPTG